MVWGNWTLFKNYFYQNLFATMYNFKKKFIIYDSKSLNNLQDSLGSIIENFKTNNKDPEHMNYSLIDLLDDGFYDEFLTLKADFDEYIPLKHNAQILTEIQNLLFKFLNGFQEKYKDQINDNFLDLMNSIKNKVGGWKVELMNSPDVSFQVSELPLGVANLYPQVFHTVQETPANLSIPQQESNLPQMDINLSSPHKEESEQEQPSPSDNIFGDNKENNEQEVNITFDGLPQPQSQYQSEFYHQDPFEGHKPKKFAELNPAIDIDKNIIRDVGIDGGILNK
jgi:hypothetical protein